MLAYSEFIITNPTNAIAYYYTEPSQVDIPKGHRAIPYWINQTYLSGPINYSSPNTNETKTEFVSKITPQMVFAIVSC